MRENLHVSALERPPALVESRGLPRLVALEGRACGRFHCRDGELPRGLVRDAAEGLVPQCIRVVLLEKEGRPCILGETGIAGRERAPAERVGGREPDTGVLGVPFDTPVVHVAVDGVPPGLVESRGLPRLVALEGRARFALDGIDNSLPETRVFFRNDGPRRATKSRSMYRFCRPRQARRFRPQRSRR